MFPTIFVKYRNDTKHIFMTNMKHPNSLPVMSNQHDVLDQ